MQYNEPSLIQKNLSGEYAFDIRALLQFAHQTTIRNWLPILGGATIALVLLMVFAMILLSVFEVTDPFNVPDHTMMQIEVLATVFAAPLSVGLLLMGLRTAAKKSIKPVDVLSYYPRIFSLGLIGLLISLLTSIGLMLFIIPGLYLYLATGFVLPLMAEKHMRPIAAIQLSVQMVNRYISQFLILFGVMLLSLLVSVLSFGILLLYFVPFFYVLKGKIYMDLFGYGEISDPIDEIEEHKDDETFMA